ncbi:GNAT family N-acetyltransferase [Actinoplanes sp. NEAU-A12]|uniref:GNAT family N-acetyltransferase n=1 Tax=Actinoplanes sandaracinus TaxID=3045177 RepID=A0ABT6WHY1_9ACTN|nr:GNAT family N-acetyltransferase [Actinoplanes sandaracinus]MDI6099341.1 GNAT family N-acetyltransferase [Actinoplanes sandaracinus]
MVSDLAELYELVYSEAPYKEGPEQVERFRKSFLEEVNRPGFAMITAHDGAGCLTGVAYGWTMPAGSWWSKADHEPSASIHNAEKFAIMEWIVHPSQRRRGVGNELLSRLLRNRPEHYATLASDPRSEARKIYANAGWKKVAQSTLTWGPSMDLLVLKI